MVPVTFSGFWGGYWSREGSGGRTMSTERHLLSVHKIFHERTTREQKGGAENQVPHPSPQKIRTGKNARPVFLQIGFLVRVSFLEFFEEEAFVDLAGVAGLAQVVLFEGACAAGGVSAPAGNRLQIITT